MGIGKKKPKGFLKTLSNLQEGSFAIKALENSQKIDEAMNIINSLKGEYPLFEKSDINEKLQLLESILEKTKNNIAGKTEDKGISFDGSKAIIEIDLPETIYLKRKFSIESSYDMRNFINILSNGEEYEIPLAENIFANVGLDSDGWEYTVKFEDKTGQPLHKDDFEKIMEIQKSLDLDFLTRDSWGNEGNCDVLNVSDQTQVELSQLFFAIIQNYKK